MRGRKTASYPRFVATPCRALSGNQGQPHSCDRWVCSVAKQPITSHHNCKQTVTWSIKYGVWGVGFLEYNGVLQWGVLHGN